MIKTIQKKILKIFINIIKSTNFRNSIFSIHFKNCCMKKTVLVLFCIVSASRIFAQSQTAEITIIPEPVKLTKNAGYFVLPKNCSIEIPSSAELKELSNMLKKRLSASTGYTVSLAANNPNATIRFVLNKSADQVIGSEGYTLLVSPKSILIKANQPAG